MRDIYARFKDLMATVTGRRNSGARPASESQTQSADVNRRGEASQMAEIVGKVNQHGGGMSIDR